MGDTGAGTGHDAHAHAHDAPIGHEAPSRREPEDRTQQLYHHIQIFGHPGSYTVRLDNDADTEQTFSRYNEALLWAIRYLASSGIDLPLRRN